MAITQKDLMQADMGYYVALISDEDGMDAAGELNIEFTEIVQREIAKILIPMILDGGYRQPYLPDKERKQAYNNAEEIAQKTSGAGGGALTGIMMRKNLANVQGDVVAAVMPKKAWDDLQRKDRFEKAIDFMQYTVQIFKGRTFERIDNETREDIIDEIEAAQEWHQRKSKRRAKR